MNRALTRILLALGLTLVAVSVTFLVPLCLRLRHVEAEITDYQRALLEQEVVQPLQAELTKLNTQQPPAGLAAPVRAPLRSADLPGLPEIFQAPARQAGLTLVQLSTDVQGLPLDSYRQLAVTVTVDGACSGFHDYLLRLCRLPFLAELRRVTIRRAGPNQVQMTISAMLSVQG